MNDVGGLGRIPNRIERVDRTNPNRDRAKRPPKKEEQRRDPKKKSEPASSENEGNTDEEKTSVVIDVRDDERPEETPAPDGKDPDDEERGLHIDTRV